MCSFDPEWEDATWEPPTASELDVVRELVRIRRERNYCLEYIAERIAVPLGLLERLEAGGYPPFDDLIGRYAQAIEKASIPLPFDPQRDPAIGWLYNEIELDDCGEVRFRGIPACRGSIGAVVDQHFPRLTRHGRIYYPHSGCEEDVASEVFVCDQDIRDILARQSIVVLSKGSPGRRRVKFAAASGTASLLKRMLAAIDAKSPARYRKASLLLNAEAQELLSKALDDMGEIGHSYSELFAEAIGPARDDPYWAKRQQQIQGAIELVKTGRPSAEWRDECIRIIIVLWSHLGGEPIHSLDPASRDPKFCEPGEMPAFVRDIAAIYVPYGLNNAAPRNSGSRWSRVLAPLIKK